VPATAPTIELLRLIPQDAPGHAAERSGAARRSRRGKSECRITLQSWARNRKEKYTIFQGYSPRW
jgi:hypothetical protein